MTHWCKLEARRKPAAGLSVKRREQVVRVCVVGDGRSLAIRGLTSDEFIQHLAAASCGWLHGAVHVRRRINGKVSRWRLAPRIPAGLAFAFYLVSKLADLSHQDVLVCDRLDWAGFLVCTVGRVLRKKTVISIHGFWEEERKIRSGGRNDGRLLTLLTDLVFRWADLFVVNDSGLAHRLSSRGVTARRIYVRRVFVDTHRFSRHQLDESATARFRERHKLPADYVLFVGSLNAWDGADDMCRVVEGVSKSYSDVRFVLVGDGELGIAIGEWIARKGYLGRVSVLRELPYCEMPLLYSGAQVLVLPNRPPQAGVSRLALEALAMEIPVVAYDVGEAGLAVKTGVTGHLVQLDDADGLVSSVSSLLARPTARTRMGRQGRIVVMAGFSLEKWLDRWVSAVDRLYSVSSKPRQIVA